MHQPMTRRARTMQQTNPNQTAENNRIRTEFIRLKKLGLTNREAARGAQGEATSAEINTAIAAAVAKRDAVAGVAAPRMTGDEKLRFAKLAREARAKAVRESVAGKAAPDRRVQAPPAEPTPAAKAARKELERRLAADDSDPPLQPPVAASVLHGGAIPDDAEHGNYPDVLKLAIDISGAEPKNRKQAEQIIRAARRKQRGEAPEEE